VIRQIFNGMLMAGASTIVAGLAWLILRSDVELAKMLVNRKFEFRITRIVTALFLLVGIGLLAVCFWLLGGLYIGLR